MAKFASSLATLVVFVFIQLPSLDSALAARRASTATRVACAVGFLAVSAATIVPENSADESLTGLRERTGVSLPSAHSINYSTEPLMNPDGHIIRAANIFTGQIALDATQFSKATYSILIDVRDISLGSLGLLVGGAANALNNLSEADKNEPSGIQLETFQTKDGHFIYRLNQAAVSNRARQAWADFGAAIRSTDSYGKLGRSVLQVGVSAVENVATVINNVIIVAASEIGPSERQQALDQSAQALARYLEISLGLFAAGAGARRIAAGAANSLNRGRYSRSDFLNGFYDASLVAPFQGISTADHLWNFIPRSSASLFWRTLSFASRPSSGSKALQMQMAQNSDRYDPKSWGQKFAVSQSSPFFQKTASEVIQKLTGKLRTGVTRQRAIEIANYWFGHFGDAALSKSEKLIYEIQREGTIPRRFRTKQSVIKILYRHNAPLRMPEVGSFLNDLGFVYLGEVDGYSKVQLKQGVELSKLGDQTGEGWLGSYVEWVAYVDPLTMQIIEVPSNPDGGETESLYQDRAQLLATYLSDPEKHRHVVFHYGTNSSPSEILSAPVGGILK